MTAHEHPLGTELHALARRQHGMVSAAQLHGLGWTRRRIRRAVERRHLLLVHRGVYAVGHVPRTHQGRYAAAVLSGPPDALLAYRSCAALHGCFTHHHGRPEIVSTTQGRGRPGVTRHWTRRLRPGERTVRDGIPTTTVARALVDMADVLGDDPWELAVRSAERQRLVDRADLRAIRGRRGCARLLRVIDPVRSVLEADFKAFLLRHGLPLPVFNAELEGIGEVDAAWPGHRLVVELDSWQHHGGRAAFERDRERDAELAAAGWTRVRVTWRMLQDEPVALFRRLLGTG